MASKQPLDLTRLFESISGSDAYKADYEKYDLEMKEAQERFAFVQSKKKTTAAEKRQKKEQKVEAEKHVKMQQQLVTYLPFPPRFQGKKHRFWFRRLLQTLFFGLYSSQISSAFELLREN